MKKFSVILLVAILAMACVFADDVKLNATLSGSVDAAYTFDLDTTEYYYEASDSVDDGAIYKTNSAPLIFTVNPIVKTSASADGVYGIIDATVKFGYKATTAATALDYKLYLNKFAIVKPNVWTLNLLGGEIGNFAAGAGDKVGKLAVSTVTAASATAGTLQTFKNIKGVSFIWNLNEKDSLTFVGKANRDEAQDGKYAIGAQTSAFTIIEGDTATEPALSLQGFAGFEYNDGWTFDGSFKIASNTDVVKVTAAMDNQLTKVSYVDTPVYNLDATVTASFGPFAEYTPKYATTASKTQFATVTLGLSKYNTYNKNGDLLLKFCDMDAKVVFNTKAWDVDAFASVEVMVEGKKILDKDARRRALNAYAKVSLGDDYYVKAGVNNILYTGKTMDFNALGEGFEDPYLLKYKATDLSYIGRGVINPSSAEVYLEGDIKVGDCSATPASFGVDNYAKVYYLIGDKKIGYTIKSTYADPNLNAYLSIDNSFDIDDNKKTLKLGAGVSTEIIPNTVLSLDYEGKDILKGSEEYKWAKITDQDKGEKQALAVNPNGLGTIKASCTISF